MTFDLTKELFKMDNNPFPDVIVIALQEMTGNSAVANDILDSWKKIFLNNINSFGDYILIKQKHFIGLALLIFAKDQFKNRVKKVAYDEIKFGYLSSCGSVIIKLYIDDSSFCFINCKLESGAKYFSQRIDNIKYIHSKAFQVEGVGIIKVKSIFL